MPTLKTKLNLNEFYITLGCIKPPKYIHKTFLDVYRNRSLLIVQMVSIQSFSFMKVSRLKIFWSSNRSKKSLKTLCIKPWLKQRDVQKKTFHTFMVEAKRKLRIKVKVLLILRLVHLFSIKTLEGRSKLPTESASDFDSRGGKKILVRFFICYILKVSSCALAWKM